VTVHFERAKRVNTPIIAGLAGPTKSGKTLSALRLATGLAQGGTIAMINTEGARGHQYADKFEYVATDISPPFSPAVYIEAVKAAIALKPAVIIIDSMSHMHDGPGGLLEYHDAEVDRLAGSDERARKRVGWGSAWVKPKAEENQFVYALLGAACAVILCFRAKEKTRLVTGGAPIDLGWQPIASERVSFETLFTLLLPPHCKGVPDLSISEMREPFDTIIPAGKPLSEETGAALAAWAAGGTKKKAAPKETGEAGTEVTASPATSHFVPPASVVAALAEAEDLTGKATPRQQRDIKDLIARIVAETGDTLATVKTEVRRMAGCAFADLTAGVAADLIPKLEVWIEDGSAQEQLGGGVK
jgi:hypothetical protein